jgi:hypothetical protein
MRSPRIVVAAIAVAVTATMATAPSTASAQVETHRTVAVQKADTAPRAATSITAKVVKIRPAANKPAKLYLTGRVYGAKGDGKVSIQVATLCDKAKGTCNFRYYRTARLNSSGVYKGQISAPPTRRSYLWRARIGTATSDIWQTCTKRTDQKTCQIPYK